MWGCALSFSFRSSYNLVGSLCAADPVAAGAAKVLPAPGVDDVAVGGKGADVGAPVLVVA